MPCTSASGGGALAPVLQGVVPWLQARMPSCMTAPRPDHNTASCHLGQPQNMFANKQHAPQTSQHYSQPVHASALAHASPPGVLRVWYVKDPAELAPPRLLVRLRQIQPSKVELHLFSFLWGIARVG